MFQEKHLSHSLKTKGAQPKKVMIAHSIPITMTQPHIAINIIITKIRDTYKSFRWKYGFKTIFSI